MKLGIVYHNFFSPKFAGGGSVHAYEVTLRLKKYFEVICYPSSPAFNWDRETLLKKAKELESKGIKIAEEFYLILDEKERFEAKGIKRFIYGEKIAKEIAKRYNVNVNFLYDPDHSSFDIFYFKKVRFGFTLHLPPYYEDSLLYLRRLIKFYGVNPYTGKGFHTRFLYNEFYAKPKYKRLLRENKPAFIAAVSEGPLVESGLKGEVIRPGNAFDPSLLKYRGRGKEDYVVFWSRLNQDKGIQEIPDILRIISKRKRVKLVLMGKFFDKYNERRFWNKVKRYGLDVEYLGFVERDKLYDVVSKAKLFIYPSHVDGFSLVVLESLALGTPVVAYDIPAIRSIYGGLGAVKVVKEFDNEAMANEALKLLLMSERDLEDLMNDEKLINFLKLYSSWDNVAESVKRIIEKYMYGSAGI